VQSDVGSRAFQNARLRKQFKKQAAVLLPAAVAPIARASTRKPRRWAGKLLKICPTTLMRCICLAFPNWIASSSKRRNGVSRVR
jgi:hypothetical protein